MMMFEIGSFWKVYAFPASICLSQLENDSIKSLLITSQRTSNINRLLLAGVGVHAETISSVKVLCKSWHLSVGTGLVLLKDIQMLLREQF